MKMTSNERSTASRSGVSRRQFLRGLGVCLALPAFESVAPVRLLGAEKALAVTATGAPLRTAFLYFPNGVIPSAWWPANEGTDFPLSETLKPLEASRAHIQVLGGLDQRNAEPGPDGAGDHARANGTFLTGVRMKKSAADVHAGISIDQVMAREIGHLTRFPSLEMTCDYSRKTGACDSGYACAYQYNISWRSATTPMAPEYNPRLIFERLFGSGGSPSQRAESLKRRQDEQRSILDFVMADARGLQRRLGSRDKDKLDEYLTGVREIETRIQKAEHFGPAHIPDIEVPAGVPPDYGEYMQVMFDMLILAFQTDSTRVATMLLAHDGDNRSFADIGVPEGHHDLSHHFDDPVKIKKVADIDRWYVRQFAKLLQKMQNTKDVDGNPLLQNSMIIYGGGNADGNRHTHSNLPIVLAGGGGVGLKTGRYLKHHSVPMTNLYLTMADRLGIQNLERFGDSTGRLADV